jgi:hypothetical protein
VKLDLADVLIILGALAIVAGAAYMYLPAGLIVAGLVLAAAGVLLSTTNPRR